MVKIFTFFKRKDTLVASIFLGLIIVGAVIRGYLFSKKINNSSDLCYGVIIHEGAKHFTYEFFVSGTKFEGNISGKKNYKLGDTIVLQYYTIDPIYHIVHSKKDTVQVERIKKKFVRIWDAM